MGGAGGRAGVRLAAVVAAGIIAAACASAGGASSGTLAQPAPADSVSVGYQQIARRDLTGAVQSIVIPDSTRQRYSRVEDMLVGRVPGLQLIPDGAGGYALRLRGTTSIEGNNEPLIVVDGMEVGQSGEANILMGLSPSDIERIDIIKDGQTAIYGSRGGAGVIVITTRRGRSASR